jgi:hypothetical protein
MIRFIYSLIALIIVSNASAQIEYNKKYFSFNNYRAQDFSIVNDNLAVIGSENFGLSSFFHTIDVAGNVIQSKSFAGSNHLVLSKLMRSVDSTFIAVGDVFNTSNQLTNGLCVRLNSQGDTLWTKTFGSNLNNDVKINDVVQKFDSTFIMVGNNGNEAFVMQLDLQGNMLWSKGFSLSGAGASILEFHAVDVAANGTIIVAGSHFTSTQGEQGIVLKIDASSLLLDAKIFNESTFFKEMKTINNATYLFDQHFGALVKLDSMLNFEWANTYCNFYSEQTGNDAFIEQDTSGMLLFATNDAFYGHVLKIDDFGNPLSEITVIGKSIKSIEKEDGTLCVLSNGPVLGLKSAFVSNPHYGIMQGFSNECAFNQSSFAFPYEFTLNPITLTETGPLVQSQVAISVNNSLVDTEVGCIDILGDLDEVSEADVLTVFPNPTSGLCTLRLNTIEPTAIEILDATGKVIVSFVMQLNEMTFDATTLDSGVYFVKAQDKLVRLVIQK